MFGEVILKIKGSQQYIHYAGDLLSLRKYRKQPKHVEIWGRGLRELTSLYAGLAFCLCVQGSPNFMALSGTTPMGFEKKPLPGATLG